MPLYDYQCRACRTVNEVRHGFREAYEGTCSACGSSDLARVFTPAGIVFKGSGFYVTDSRAKSTAGAKSEKSEKSEGGSSSETGTAAAPAAGSSDSGSTASGAAASTGTAASPPPAASAPAKTESSAA